MRLHWLVIGWLVLSFSGCTTAAEAERQRAYQHWFNSLPAHEQVAIEQERMRAAAWAISNMRFGAPPTTPVYMQPAVPRTCTTQPLGSSFTTNCY